MSQMFEYEVWSPSAPDTLYSVDNFIDGEFYAKKKYSHPLDKNIPFYRCLRFFYPGLLSQPRL